MRRPAVAVAVVGTGLDPVRAVVVAVAVVGTGLDPVRAVVVAVAVTVAGAVVFVQELSTKEATRMRLRLNHSIPFFIYYSPFFAILC